MVDLVAVEIFYDRHSRRYGTVPWGSADQFGYISRHLTSNGSLGWKGCCWKLIFNSLEDRPDVHCQLQLPRFALGPTGPDIRYSWTRFWAVDLIRMKSSLIVIEIKFRNNKPSAQNHVVSFCEKFPLKITCSLAILNRANIVHSNLHTYICTANGACSANCAALGTNCNRSPPHHIITLLWCTHTGQRDLHLHIAQYHCKPGAVPPQRPLADCACNG